MSGGTFGEMGNLLKQAQQMQRELERAREELRGARVDGQSSGSLVRAEFNGEGMLLKISIRPEAMVDKASLESRVLEAMVDGLTRAKALRDERMGKVMGGMSLPGIF